MTVRTVQMEKNVDMIQEDSGNSTQIITNSLNVSLGNLVYHNFLEETMCNFLQDEPLTTKITMWFMHASTLPHLSLVACNFLTAIYENHRIYRGGPQAWPA